MMCEYLGQRQAAVAIENAVIELLRSKRLKGVGTGDHPTSEVGDLVTAEIRQVPARV
jgi:isocitrate/isopropylmalate dehydrogenase